MIKTYFPSLYLLNTRVLLTEMSQKLGRIATLDDFPDSEMDKIAASGFDWVWLLTVWQTGVEGQRISRENKGWREEFVDTLPDLREEDIAGSGFAITRYVVTDHLGGDDSLARLRERLRKRNLKLMLDFVPNHTGLDHWWINEHPGFYITATVSDMEREPANYTRINTGSGDLVIAHGRDPYFSGWPDTAQLNYGNPDLHEAMIGELIKIAGQCDGVRCDMAMLVLPDVFERTWGIKCQPFWPNAIAKVREENPGFCFMAEVYWDMEWTLIEQGFDYAYDKRLYDRLKEGNAQQVRQHLTAPLDYQSRMARFLENHDETRVAAAFLPDMHEAAAIITFLSPGIRFFHQGQFEGRLKKISPHLVRGPKEAVNERVAGFYSRLIGLLQKPVFRSGEWALSNCAQAWNGNFSNENYISFTWNGAGEEKILVVVNYSQVRSQCYVSLPFGRMEGKSWMFNDLMSETIYGSGGNELIEKGLYMDEPPWKYYVFSVSQK